MVFIFSRRIGLDGARPVHEPAGGRLPDRLESLRIPALDGGGRGFRPRSGRRPGLGAGRGDSYRARAVKAADIVTLEAAPNGTVLVRDHRQPMVGEGFFGGDQGDTVDEQRGDLDPHGETASAQDQQRHDGGEKTDMKVFDFSVPKS